MTQAEHLAALRRLTAALKAHRGAYPRDLVRAVLRHARAILAHARTERRGHR